MKVSKLIVHGGVFHADDVMCAALVRMINPDVQVERVFQVPENPEDGTVVADIGGGRYDHHQSDAEKRENGEKYAACGLLLRDCWRQIFPDEASYRSFDEDVIRPIERMDNGVVSNPFSLAVSSFVPNWDSEETMDQAFESAVAFVTGFLDRRVETAKSGLRAAHIVEESLENSNGGIVVLPQFCPWQNTLVLSSARFVVYPSNRGGYNLQTVPEKVNGFTAKQSIPEEWLTERPEGCSFVHQALFLAAFDTEEHAVSAAKNIY
ncbi:MAG: MYG1 family protein [Clostridiales bacterium]|nr:MYG1 family protein [Clostridiales bacterium]